MSDFSSIFLPDIKQNQGLRLVALKFSFLEGIQSVSCFQNFMMFISIGYFPFKYFINKSSKERTKLKIDSDRNVAKIQLGNAQGPLGRMS